MVILIKYLYVFYRCLFFFNIVHEVLLFQTEEVVGGHFKIWDANESFFFFQSKTIVAIMDDRQYIVYTYT